MIKNTSKIYVQEPRPPLERRLHTGALPDDEKNRSAYLINHTRVMESMPPGGFPEQGRKTDVTLFLERKTLTERMAILC